MTLRKTPVISVRKHPKQARSTQLVADVLEAAIRVLKSEGASGFTMARVAEKAGVSVGSLYQYFPNKEAILFRLQTDEWTDTIAMLQGILAARALPPPERLKTAVSAFIRSECDEAPLRVALDDAAPFYHDTPEASAIRTAVAQCIDTFLAEAAPDMPAKDRILASDVLLTTLSAVGKKVSEENRPRENQDAFAEAIGDMLCAYLVKLSMMRPVRDARLDSMDD